MDCVNDMDSEYVCGHVIMRRRLGEIRELESRLKGDNILSPEAKALRKQIDELYKRMGEEMHEGAD